MAFFFCCNGPIRNFRPYAPIRPASRYPPPGPTGAHRFMAGPLATALATPSVAAGLERLDGAASRQHAIDTLVAVGSIPSPSGAEAQRAAAVADRMREAGLTDEAAANEALAAVTALQKRHMPVMPAVPALGAEGGAPAKPTPSALRRVESSSSHSTATTAELDIFSPPADQPLLC